MSEQHFSRREKRAREKARPELDRKCRHILVGESRGACLKAYLESNGISGTVQEEPSGHIISLGPSADLDRVQDLMDQWKRGEDCSSQSQES